MCQYGRRRLADKLCSCRTTCTEPLEAAQTVEAPPTAQGAGMHTPSFPSLTEPAAPTSPRERPRRRCLTGHRRLSRRGKARC